MRISDWSSDVCSSDLRAVLRPRPRLAPVTRAILVMVASCCLRGRLDMPHEGLRVLPGPFGSLPNPTKCWRADREIVRSCHDQLAQRGQRSEEHPSELQSLMRISYAVFCLKKN